MKILVLGASSYVGARLYFDLKTDHEVTGTYATNKLSKEFVKLDITNKDDVEHAFATFKPEVIVHAANNADPRWCEANKTEARLLNEQSTHYIAAAAEDIGAELIYISSYAAVKPANVYSETKHSSEQIIKATCRKWLILRPSLIIGYSPNTTNDRPFNRFLKNLDEGTPAEYDTSWKFQPTWVGHLSEVIGDCISKGILNETVLVASPQQVNRYTVANDILAPFGVSVTPVDKHDLSTPFSEDLSVLHTLGLPEYSYKQIIDKIIHEIQHREQYQLP